MTSSPRHHVLSALSLTMDGEDPPLAELPAESTQDPDSPTISESPTIPEPLSETAECELQSRQW